MEILREELYRRVWEQPVAALAKEFDISDVGLAKACRANAIPLPPRGYWMKLQHGKAVSKPALPPSKITKVVLDARRHRVTAPLKRAKQPGDIPQKVTVLPSSDGRPLAPFTSATKKALLGFKSKADFLHAAGKDMFDCRVSRAAVDEACQLLDAIERAVASYGGALQSGEKSLEFELEGQRVAFRLVEQFTTTQEPEPGKKYASWERPPLVYHFSGRFSLEVLGYFEGRKKWSDGKQQRLADVLPEFMDGLVHAALAMRQRRLEQEEQARKWREEAERRAALERQAKDRADFRLKLLQEAQAQHEYETLVAYVADLRQRLDSFVGPLPEATTQWLRMVDKWAGEPDVLSKRTRRLASGIKTDFYTGTFGKPLG